MRSFAGLTVTPFLIHRTLPVLELRQRQRKARSVPTVSFLTWVGRVVIVASLHIPGIIKASHLYGASVVTTKLLLRKFLTTIF